MLCVTRAQFKNKLFLMESMLLTRSQWGCISISPFHNKQEPSERPVTIELSETPILEVDPQNNNLRLLVPEFLGQKLEVVSSVAFQEGSPIVPHPSPQPGIEVGISP